MLLTSSVVRWSLPTTYLIPVRSFFRTGEEKRERRKELWDEAKKGYFSDFHGYEDNGEFRKNGGKVSEASSNLFSRKEAMRFPLVTGKSLTGNNISLPLATNDRVSLVLLWMRAFGIKACDEYRNCFTKEFVNHPLTCVYELSIVEQMIFRMMSPLLYRNLKQQISAERHSNLFCYHGRFMEEKKLLGVHNSIIGYAFLVDPEGLVRWKAHAKPTEKELKYMIKCTRELIEKLST